MKEPVNLHLLNTLFFLWTTKGETKKCVCLLFVGVSVYLCVVGGGWGGSIIKGHEIKDFIINAQNNNIVLTTQK